MYDCTTVRKHDHACSKCPLLQVFKNVLVMGRLGSGIQVSASFQKNAHLMGPLRSGPRLVGRVGSGVLVSDSYHVLSCVVVRAVSGQVLCTP